MISTHLENLLFYVVRPIVLKREKSLDSGAANSDLGADGISATHPEKHEAGANPTTFSSENYFEWRNLELTQQFEDHFSASDIAAKDILDYGCGSGFLSWIIASNGARSVVGIDLNESDIEFAKKAMKPAAGLVQPSFRIARDPIKIDTPDHSFDVIVCFDVVEHISQYGEVLNEWFRVLRPGGKILIWWQPYFHPYGHHLMSYIPLPWVHALFPPQILANVCNRIFLMPEYKARFWEIDENGNKRTDRLFTKETVLGDLNQVTISAFEKACKRAGFHFVRRESHPFGNGGVISAVSKGLCKIPVIREFFTAYMIYELGLTQAPEAPAEPQ